MGGEGGRPGPGGMWRTLHVNLAPLLPKLLPQPGPRCGCGGRQIRARAILCNPLAEVHVGARRGKVSTGAVDYAKREVVEPAGKPRGRTSSISRAAAHGLGCMLVKPCCCGVFSPCPAATSASCRSPAQELPHMPLLTEMPLRPGWRLGSALSL